MRNKKFRWSKVYESPEEELVEFLRSRNLESHRFVVEESGALTQQLSDHPCIIWCAEGSLVVRQDSAATSLQPGDALHVSENVPYDLTAGMTGCVCYITD